MDLGLEGRVVIVTGATRGIGKAAALRFAAEGAHVVVTYLNDRDSAEHVARLVEERGTQAVVCRFDLRDPATMRQIAADSVSRWGRVGALVNNAVDWVPVARITAHLDKRWLERTAAALPIRRLPNADDVTVLIVFLSSAASRAITGETVRASGGRA